jgi:hypothetical protein
VYVLTASVSGLTTVVHDQVVVDVGKHVEIALRLKVAPVSETVTVAAQLSVADPLG